jgi:hypothetical protein
MTHRISVQDHPQIAAIERRYRRGEGPRAIARWLDDAGHPPLSEDQVWRYGTKHWRSEPTEVEVPLDSADGDIVEAVEAARVEAAKVGGRVSRVTVEKRAGTWDAQTKRGIDELQSQRSGARVTVVLDDAPGGQRAEVRQAAPVDVTVKVNARLPKRQATPGHWGIILPDRQRPFHDAAAVDITHQIIADLEAAHGIAAIVNLGDDIDLPDLSKHRSTPSALGRIQEAIDGQYLDLATQRALAPDADIYWLAGNHDQRLIDWLVDNAPTLVGLSRAGDDDTPVLSLPFLCRLDELGVRYQGPYPDGSTVWLNDRLRCIHGETVKSQRGGTAASLLAELPGVSTVCGHIHRHELVHDTVNRRHGPVAAFAGSPGSLCRIDGMVPSAKTRSDADGTPALARYERWQQGLWVVWYEADGDHHHLVEPVSIWQGRATWRGRTYVARVDVDGNPLTDAA